MKYYTGALIAVGGYLYHKASGTSPAPLFEGEDPHAFCADDYNPRTYKMEQQQDTFILGKDSITMATSQPYRTDAQNARTSIAASTHKEMALFLLGPRSHEKNRTLFDNLGRRMPFMRVGDGAKQPMSKEAIVHALKALGTYAPHATRLRLHYELHGGLDTDGHALQTHHYVPGATYMHQADKVFGWIAEHLPSSITHVHLEAYSCQGAAAIPDLAVLMDTLVQHQTHTDIPAKLTAIFNGDSGYYSYINDMAGYTHVSQMTIQNDGMNMPEQRFLHCMNIKSPYNHDWYGKKNTEFLTAKHSFVTLTQDRTDEKGAYRWEIYTPYHDAATLLEAYAQDSVGTIKKAYGVLQEVKRQHPGLVKHYVSTPLQLLTSLDKQQLGILFQHTHHIAEGKIGNDDVDFGGISNNTLSLNAETWADAFTTLTYLMHSKDNPKPLEYIEQYNASIIALTDDDPSTRPSQNMLITHIQPGVGFSDKTTTAEQVKLQLEQGLVINNAAIERLFHGLGNRATSTQIKEMASEISNYGYFRAERLNNAIQVKSADAYHLKPLYYKADSIVLSNLNIVEYLIQSGCRLELSSMSKNEGDPVPEEYRETLTQYYMAFDILPAKAKHFLNEHFDIATIVKQYGAENITKDDVASQLMGAIQYWESTEKNTPYHYMMQAFACKTQQGNTLLHEMMSDAFPRGNTETQRGWFELMISQTPEGAFLSKRDTLHPMLHNMLQLSLPLSEHERTSFHASVFGIKNIMGQNMMQHDFDHMHAKLSLQGLRDAYEAHFPKGRAASTFKAYDFYSGAISSEEMVNYFTETKPAYKEWSSLKAAFSAIDPEKGEETFHALWKQYETQRGAKEWRMDIMPSEKGMLPAR